MLACRLYMITSSNTPSLWYHRAAFLGDEGKILQFLVAPVLVLDCHRLAGPEVDGEALAYLDPGLCEDWRCMESR